MPRFRRPHPSPVVPLRAGRGWVLHLVMALVLLFAQTQATLHWLSHSTAAVQGAVRVAQGRAIEASTRDQDRTAPRNDPSLDLSCDKCASLASLSAMLHGDTFRLSLQEGRDVQVAALVWSSAERILRLGYLSRAPPTAG